MRAVVQATLTILTWRAYLLGLKTEKIFVSDNKEEDDEQEDSLVTISRQDFMKYVSKIQKENHEVTYLKRDVETNPYLR